MEDKMDVYMIERSESGQTARETWSTTSVIGANATANGAFNAVDIPGLHAKGFEVSTPFSYTRPGECIASWRYQGNLFEIVISIYKIEVGE
jgi:hypothetical protein